VSPLPQVRAGEFEGPLDLLLDEVRCQRVRVEDLQMAPLVARFLSYVRAAAERDLALHYEWLPLAATLIEWKARHLVDSFRKADEKDEPDAVREEIVRLLQAHRQELASDLADRRERASRRHSRPEGWDGYRRMACTEPSDPDEPGTVSVWDLEQQARQLADEVEEERAKLRAALSITADPHPVAEMAEWLRRKLRDDGPADALPLLAEQPTAWRRSALFLAILECARVQHVVLEQVEPFGPLYVTSMADE
jgi:segregation and condensation protein A